MGFDENITSNPNYSAKNLLCIVSSTKECQNWVTVVIKTNVLHHFVMSKIFPENNDLEKHETTVGVEYISAHACSKDTTSLHISHLHVNASLHTVD